MIRQFFDAYWSESFWLPSSLTWDEFYIQAGPTCPRPFDLLILPFVTILFLILRILFERYIVLLVPFSKWTASKDRTQNKAAFHDFKEEFVGGKTTGKRGDERVTRRSFSQKHSILQKSKESAWKFSFYLFIFVYGITVLYKKEWFLDVKYCWHNYPRHPFTTGLRVYYFIEMGFYSSLLITQFVDTRRKDFWAMLFHHVVTLTLLSFSYVTNLVRVGTLVMVTHDVCDILLEGAKIAKYCKQQKLCDRIFVTFTVTWFATRILLFPLCIIASALFDGPRIFDLHFPAYKLLASLLVLLFFLHIFWFRFICKIAYKAYKTGHVTKDERSDSEDSDTQSSDGGSAAAVENEKTA